MKRFSLILMLMATPLWAVEPVQSLSDPEQEARAQVLEQAITCLYCEGLSIAAADVELAQAYRMLVRALIAEGLGDADVHEYLRLRYGQSVVMPPETKP